MLISIRSTNGGGKSTLIRALIQKASRQRLVYGVLGTKQPEAYELVFPQILRPVYVLGPYLTPTGGCDRIQPYDLILDLLEKYSKLGHVLFEGVIVGGTYGRVGRFMEQFGKEAVMAFLDTPLEACIANVQSRRAVRDDARPFNPHNLTVKFKTIQQIKLKAETEGKLRVEVISMQDGPTQVLKLLRSAK